MGNQTPFAFDASSKDLYLMVKTGATLDIVPQELFRNPLALVGYLNDHAISFISWVPTALSVVSRLGTFAKVRPETLEKVFFVGESMPAKDLAKWREALPEARFVNLYGSSEIAGIACFHEIRGEIPEGEPIPIGKPLGNCRIRLVSDGRTVTAPGQTGEIHIASAALATGYLNRPELTAERFVECLGEDGPERWFRTGDLARYDRNGDLVFVSRNDCQIKHMGYRIELGEIEAVAERAEGVRRACCVYHAKKAQIHLFCEPEAGAAPTKRGILGSLSRALPAYMIPGKIDILQALPLNANGKIDRCLLSETPGMTIPHPKEDAT